MAQRIGGHLAGLRGPVVRAIVALIAIVTLAACEAAAPLPSVRTIGSAPLGATMACPLGDMLPFTLRIDPTRDDPVWGTWRSGEAFSITWPPGFHLVDEPRLALVDAYGLVIAYDGDVISDAGGGGGGSDEAVMVCSLGDLVYDLNP